jgi:hypothetical protein
MQVPMRIYLLLTVLVIGIIAGCSSAQPPTKFPSFNYWCIPTLISPTTNNVSPDIAIRNLPSIGDVHTQELGDPIIRRGLFYKQFYDTTLVPSTITTSYPLRLYWEAESGGYVRNDTLAVEALTLERLAPFKNNIGKCEHSNIGREDGKQFTKNIDVIYDWIRFIDANPHDKFTALNLYIPKGFKFVRKPLEGGAIFYEATEELIMKSSDQYLSGSSMKNRRSFVFTGIVELENSLENMAVIQVKYLDRVDDQFAIPMVGDLSFEPKSQPELILASTSANWFDQRLIYNGISGSTVRFLYREYSGDVNRVNYSQEVQYDLDQERVIGFKGARFEILQASNTSVTYRILEPFSSDIN